MIRYLVLVIVSAAVSFLLSSQLAASRQPSPANPAGAGASSPDPSAPLAKDSAAKASSPRFVRGRQDVPVTEPLKVDGAYVCDFNAGDRFVPELLERTPWKDSNGFDALLAAEGPAFNRMKRALVPHVIAQVAPARHCVDQAGVEDRVRVSLQMEIEADRSRASISSLSIARMEGAKPAQAVVERCLKGTVLAALPFSAKPADATAPFLNYRGPYPRYLSFYFGRDIDPHSGGAVSRGQAESTP
jgi:hypothetical protein